LYEGGCDSLFEKGMTQQSVLARDPLN